MLSNVEFSSQEFHEFAEDHFLDKNEYREGANDGRYQDFFNILGVTQVFYLLMVESEVHFQKWYPDSLLPRLLDIKLIVPVRNGFKKCISMTIFEKYVLCRRLVVDIESEFVANMS